jgi:hypothetical protein
MSTPDIKTTIKHWPPDALGLGCKQAFADRGKFRAVASIQQIPANPDGTGVELLIRGLLFWSSESTGFEWKNVDTSTLTWESTDDELIAAAVKILEQAEGGQ